MHTVSVAGKVLKIEFYKLARTGHVAAFPGKNRNCFKSELKYLKFKGHHNYKHSNS